MQKYTRLGTQQRGIIVPKIFPGNASPFPTTSIHPTVHSYKLNTTVNTTKLNLVQKGNNKQQVPFPDHSIYILLIHSIYQ